MSSAPSLHLPLSTPTEDSQKTWTLASGLGDGHPELFSTLRISLTWISLCTLQVDLQDVCASVLWLLEKHVACMNVI